MKSTIHRSLISTAFIIVTIGVILTSISIYKHKTTIKRELNYRFQSTQIEEHRPTIEKYAKEYNVEDHVETLMAMMMQESGGRGNDPMQASESLCGKIGCIDDSEKSIKHGVAYFKQTLEAAEGDVQLAVQSYNFGIGFAYYVLERNQTFNQQIVIEFSKEMYEKAEDPSIYSCLRKEGKQYNACYGDIYYVRDVMAYRDIISEK